MCMNKNDLINDIAACLIMTMEKEQVDIVKAVFTVKMKDYEIHEVCTNNLPSTEVIDNEHILKRFSVDMLAKGLKKSSIKSYMNTMRPFFRNTRLNFREVTAQHVTDYLALKKIETNANGKTNSQNYVANICRVLFVFFQWAYRKHHIDKDIMLDVDRIRAKQKKKDRLTQEEMEACRECARGDREKALLELMLSTGLRVGEIAALKIEDMDLHARRIHINEGKSDSAERDVYLSIRARNAIRKYIGSRNTGYVFRPTRNILNEDVQISNGTIQKIAKAIGRRAGAHCVTTVHVYRKTFASEEYRKTGNSKLVSVLLGHSSTAITEKYYLVDDMRDIEYQALYVA